MSDCVSDEAGVSRLVLVLVSEHWLCDFVIARTVRVLLQQMPPGFRSGWDQEISGFDPEVNLVLGGANSMIDCTDQDGEIRPTMRTSDANDEQQPTVDRLD